MGLENNGCGIQEQILVLYNKWNIWKHEMSARDKLLAR